jgi:MFS family permease
MSGGLVGEFLMPADLVGAARRLHANGFRVYDAFTPAPVPELDALLPGRRGAAVAAIMAGAGVFGAVAAGLLQYYAAAIDYPINVGGRPLDSWPAFVPSAWEICALFTVYAGFFAFLLYSRLPRLFHPIFAVPDFARASQDRFFLCVDARDERFDAQRVRLIFERFRVVRISEVAE